MRSIRILAAISLTALIIAALPAAPSSQVSAQERGGSDPQHTLDLTWDRFFSHEEIGERMQLSHPLFHGG